MKYSIFKVVNGNFSIESEGFENNPAGAYTTFHGTCQALWNEKDVKSGCVMVLDENGDLVEGHKEIIVHE